MAFYRKVAPNNWQYRVSYKKTNNKYAEKSKSGFKTKSEAKAAAEKVELQLTKGADLSGDKLYTDYIKSWYETFRKPKIKPSTQKRYDQMLEVIGDMFKDMKLQDVTRTYYQKQITEYGKTHARSTTNRLHSLMKSALEHAEYEGDILKTPAFNISVTGTAKKNTVKALNREEAINLKNALLESYKPSYSSRSAILFALATGCRFGEIIALNEADFDFENSTVTISKSFDYHVEHDITNAKTDSSNRTIAVDKDTLSMVRKIIIYQKEQKMKLGVRTKDKFIFVNKDFKPISSGAANDTLTNFCNKIGASPIRFHGLRHTHASLMLLEGFPVNYISERLGHSRASTTADIYAHVLKELEEKSNDQLVSFLENLK